MALGSPAVSKVCMPTVQKITMPTSLTHAHRGTDCAHSWAGVPVSSSPHPAFLCLHHLLGPRSTADNRDNLARSEPVSHAFASGGSLRSLCAAHHHLLGFGIHDFTLLCELHCLLKTMLVTSSFFPSSKVAAFDSASIFRFSRGPRQSS